MHSQAASGPWACFSDVLFFFLDISGFVSLVLVMSTLNHTKPFTAHRVKWDE